MKQLLLLATTICTLISNGQVRMPAASPTQTITQDFGLGRMELTYSRPSLKGRAVFKEGSELAPLGKVWRLGANSVTRLKLTDPITIGGKSLDTGSYAIYAIPGKSNWTMIINKDFRSWGTSYVEADDLFRFEVSADKMKETYETFTIQFTEFKKESLEMNLMWGTVAVNIPITFNVRDRLRAQVEKALTAEKVTPNVYQAAANFYYEWDKDLPKALEHITKTVEASPKSFGAFLLKAKIEKDAGDKASAKADAEKCVALAKDAKMDEYIKLGNELLQKL